MRALPRASALVALLLSARASAVEIERVPDLGSASSPLTPVEQALVPELRLNDAATLPSINELSVFNPSDASIAAELEAVVQRQAGHQAFAPTLEAVNSLNARMTAREATDSSRRQDMTASFDVAKPSGGDGEAGEPTPGGGSGGGDGSSRGKDDGGGASYPVRMIRALGTTFKAVLFRPNVPVEEELVRAIDQTKKGDKIKIAVYEFANGKTLDALRRAKERGVNIRIIIDYSQVFPKVGREGGYTPKRSKEIWGLFREGFEVNVLKGLGQYGINHNKVMVIESTRGSLATFGSYNWKWTAERDHYENANFTSDRKRIDALGSYWNWLNGLSAKAVYDHGEGSIELQDPSHQWPQTVPAPPQFARDIEFNGVELPFLVVSPAANGGASAEDELVRAYDASKESIRVSIFALRSTKIAQALKRARERKLAVQVIIDKGQSVSPAFAAYAQWLAFHDIEVKVLSGPDPTAPFQLSQKDHHKFSLLDGKLVEVGSTNYTKYASIGNFENAHFLDDETDAKSYGFMFDHMWARADKLEAPALEPVLPTDEELIKEVFPDQQPAPEPAPGERLPEPSWPRPQSRTLVFNGETYKTVMTRPDEPVAPVAAKLIRSARKSVRLSAYEFNLPEMLDALRWLRANRPKVKIEIVIDRSHVYTTGKDHTGGPRKPSPEIVALIREGFDVTILKGDHSGIMHSKYLLIDAPASNVGRRLARVGQAILGRVVPSLAPLAGAEGEEAGLVWRGSFNFAKTAENNHYENVELSNEKDRIQNYLNDFKYKRGLAEEVDHDKLDEILARTEVPTRGGSSGRHDEEADVDPETAWLQEAQFAADNAEADGAEIEAAKKPPLPPPPSAEGREIDINGEKFQTEYFSPNGGILEAWLRGVKAAKTSIDLAMFGFYSRELADALVSALEEKRKVNPEFRLRLVLDAGQAALARFDRVPGDRTSGVRVADWFKQRGVDVKINGGPHWRSRVDPRDPMFEKMHSKYMIIDGKWVFTGSWNASDRATQDNFENATILDDLTDVAVLVWDFERMYLRSLAPGEREPVDQGVPSGLPGL